MHIRDLTKLVVVGFLFSLLAACGGGGTSRDCAPTNPNCNDPEQIINVLGADGPMANAVVELFRLSDFLGQPPSPPSLLDADARTDANGLATLTLKAADEDGSKPGDGPFLLRISSNGGTIDTTTGEAPAITSVSTIISGAQFANRASTRFYATPFTSLAVERAKGRVIAAGGDSSDPAAVEAELAAASVEVLQAVGFGMATDIDIFNTPPIIDETTVTLEEQQAVAAYRMAIETFAEVVAQAANSLGQSTDIVLEAIKIDIADGLIGDSPSTIEQAVVDAVNTVDSGYLNGKRLPSADGSATIEALLEGEFPDVSAPLAGAIDSVPAAADFDGDGFANTNDSAPYDPEVSGDSDGDGVDDAGDNCLSGWKVPADQTNPDQTDTDNDGTGDICDADQDADGVDDGQDNCLGGSDVFNTYTNTPQSIFDPNQANNDNDAFGDICDDDIDGDNALNIDDDQPFDPSVTSDKDGDGVDDVSGDGDNCIDTSFGGADTFNLFAIEGVGDDRVFSTTVVQALDDPNQGDRDDNGIGDLCDNDADGDGVLNAQDSLPFDPNSAGDADSDGIDDSTDNCIDVSFGGLQEMNPGESLSDPDQIDTDLDGLGDICDLDKDGDTIPNDKDPSELENTVSYHFDSFLLQQSSEAGSFKLETIGESVLRDTNEVVVSALANQLDLGSDSVNDNTFIVSSEYQTAENSLLLVGAGFGAAVATEVQQPPEARALVNTDTTIIASYAEPNLTLDGVELFPWGKSSFVGTQGLSLPVVGAGPLVAARRDQGLTTLLYTNASHENADLNGSYGFVDLRITYDSAVGSALVATQSRVYTMAFDGAGLVTPANVGVNQFDAVVGQGSAGDGSVKYSEPQLTPAGYSVSLDGAVTITGTDLRAMTDADGELIAVSADNLRGFGVRLDATATQADLLAGSPYALQGLFINPALNSLTAGSLNSAELSFTDVNGSIKATLNFGGSSISTSDYSELDTVLPNVSIAARNTQQSSDEVNRAVTITNGQLGRIEMGSYIPGDETPLSVELEGFFVKGKGLLLRFIETPIAAVGGGAGPATTNFYCGDPAAVEFVQLNPNGAPPTVIVPQPTNNPSCGFIIVGDSGALTKVSERARNDVGNEQLYSDILSEAETSFSDDKSGFAQGIVWGISTSP